MKESQIAFHVFFSFFNIFMVRMLLHCELSMPFLYRDGMFLSHCYHMCGWFGYNAYAATYILESLFLFFPSFILCACACVCVCVCVRLKITAILEKYLHRCSS